MVPGDSILSHEGIAVFVTEVALKLVLFLVLPVGLVSVSIIISSASVYMILISRCK